MVQTCRMVLNSQRETQMTMTKSGGWVLVGFTLAPPKVDSAVPVPLMGLLLILY